MIRGDKITGNKPTASKTNVNNEDAVHQPFNVGVLLIVLGSFFLLIRFFDFGSLALPLLSSGFIATGILRRESGWFIPGGILAGIVLGDYLTDTAPWGALSEGAETGVFLLSFALGWVGVFALSLGFGRERNTWALIPALVMTVIGGLSLSAETGARILELLSDLWPLALVVLGAFLLLKRDTKPNEAAG